MKDLRMQAKALRGEQAEESAEARDTRKNAMPFVTLTSHP